MIFQGAATLCLAATCPPLRLWLRSKAPATAFKAWTIFFAAMQVSEGEHLKAFCGFVKSNSLDGALRNHQWAKLAAGYNGPSYKDNKYDEKLAAAFVRYSK